MPSGSWKHLRLRLLLNPLPLRFCRALLGSRKPFGLYGRYGAQGRSDRRQSERSVTMTAAQRKKVAGQALRQAPWVVRRTNHFETEGRGKKCKLIHLVFGHGAVAFFALFMTAAFLWDFLGRWIRWPLALVINRYTQQQLGRPSSARPRPLTARP